jgi:hypothetical protein
MSEVLPAEALTPAASRSPRAVHRRNLALTVFVLSALGVSMSVRQDAAPEPGSLAYWLLISPAALLPLVDFGAIIATLLGRARLLLFFVLSAGAWHFIHGDTQAVMQLGLLILVMAWTCTSPACLRVGDLRWAYLALIGVGFAVWAFTDLNGWGPLPGTTVSEYGVWRVSFFPNIAYTAFLSFAVVMLLTRTPKIARHNQVILLVALYFLVFSFVRTALIAATLYFLLRWWFRRHHRPGQMFWTALLVGFGVNIAIALSVVAFDYLQQFPLISRLFLRGEAGLSTDEIFTQLYRPWLWMQHLTQFLTSPSLMGWGVFDFNDLKTEDLVEGNEQGDSVSLPTRLLASYGIPGILFTVFLVVQLRRLAWRGDRWACACFAPLFLLMMQWGSVFHPSDALFVIFMLMIMRGTAGFEWGADQQPRQGS